MFLIAKIVRGRRLLQELERQDKDEHLAGVDAGHSLSQVSKGLPQRHHQSVGEVFDDEAGVTRSRRRKTLRHDKADASSSVDATSSTSESLRLRRTSSMPSICDLYPPTTSQKHYDYDSKLNKMQRRALRFTWTRLQTRNGGKKIEAVFEQVYERLVRLLPQIREMFTTRTFLCAMSRSEVPSLRDHARVTARMIDLIIQNIGVEPSKRTDTGSKFEPREIGRAHAKLKLHGMTGTYWEKLGEMIIDVVLCQEAVRDLPGAGQAWVILTACIVDGCRAGFDEVRNVSALVLPKRNMVLHQATALLHSNGENSDDKNPETVEFAQSAVAQMVKCVQFVPSIAALPSTDEPSCSAQVCPYAPQSSPRSNLRPSTCSS